MINVHALQPLRDMLLVKPMNCETKTPGGIHRPPNTWGPAMIGTVIAVGPGRVPDGLISGRMPPDVKVGDVVLFTPNAGLCIHIGNEEHVMLGQLDVIAIVPPKAADV